VEISYQNISASSVLLEKNWPKKTIAQKCENSPNLVTLTGNCFKLQMSALI
jgi:hypothetical protein